MDKETYIRIEGMLYGHFKDKLKLLSIRNEIDLLNKSIEDIDKNIRSCNIRIDYNQQGAPISERVQSSSYGTSYAEKEIIKGIDDMEKEIARKIKKVFKLECKERDIRHKVNKMESNINMLNEEYQESINLKYNPSNRFKRTLSVREIADELCINKNKAYEHQDKIVENISKLMWMYT